MSLTAAQYAANLASARRVAAAQVGWTGPTADIPYEQKGAYLTALAHVILKSPQAFTEQTLATARLQLTKSPYEALDTYDVGDAVGDFTDEFATQAGDLGESVASVGEGVKNTLSLTRYLIPLALVAAVVIWLRNFARNAR
jgi:hypothetical protein